MRRTGAALLAWLAADTAFAATSGVYHPYVNLHEREVEYGVTWRDIGDNAASLQRASIGYAWTDNVATELYLLSEVATHDHARTRGVELEVRWQLTEQGEYASDWGLLLEFERGAGLDRNELSTGVLWEKELGHRWVATANALVEYEFGGDVDNEFETAFRGQLRYMQREAFEPALELYLDDTDYAVGPALLGARRLGDGRQLRWEAGVYFGIDADTPSLSARTNIEFEF